MPSIILKNGELLTECNPNDGALKVNSTAAAISRVGNGTFNLTITFNFTPFAVGPGTVNFPADIGLLKAVSGNLITSTLPECIAQGPDGGSVLLEVSSFDTPVIKVEHGIGRAPRPRLRNSPVVSGKNARKKPARKAAPKKAVKKAAPKKASKRK